MADPVPDFPIPGLSFLLLLLPVYYAAIYVHELGHVVAGRLCGFLVTSSGSGFVRPWWVFEVGGTRIYGCRSRPFQGLTYFWPPQLFPSRAQLAWTLAGGILANGLAAAAALALLAWIPGARALWLAIFAVNAFLAIASLIPRQVLVGRMPLRTDGMLILRALRFGGLPTPTPLVVQSVEGLDPHLEGIGDTLGSRLGLLSALLGYLELEDLGRAEVLGRRVASLPRCPVPIVGAWQVVVRATLATRSGRREEASLLTDEADAGFRALGHEAGLVLVASLRADARALDGDIPGASAELETLGSGGPGARHPALRTALLASRLTLLAGRADVDDPGALAAEYERLRSVHLPPTSDLRFYRPIARHHRRRGDLAAAESAYRRVLGAVETIADAWIDPVARASYLRAQSPLLEEIREGFEGLGKGDEAARLVAALESNPTGRPSLARAAIAREGQLRRLGLRLLLLNVVAVLVVVGGILLADSPLHVPGHAELIVSAMFLAVFSALALLYAGFHYTVGRFVPALRQSGGGVILLLALLGWAGCLVVPVISLLSR